MERDRTAARRDTVLHFTPLAVIGVHVADDAFRRTEAGVTATDHAAVALCYLRLRPRQRAVVSLVLARS